MFAPYFMLVQSIILGHVLFTSELPFTRLGMSTSLWGHTCAHWLPHVEPPKSGSLPFLWGFNQHPIRSMEEVPQKFHQSGRLPGSPVGFFGTWHLSNGSKGTRKCHLLGCQLHGLLENCPCRWLFQQNLHQIDFGDFLPSWWYRRALSPFPALTSSLVFFTPTVKPTAFTKWCTVLSTSWFS